MQDDPFTAPAKLKKNTRGMDVIQSVYAFAMGVGLTRVFLGSKTFFNDILFRANPPTDGRDILTGLLLANIVLLGLRFFWVPRNLRSLVFMAAQSMRSGNRSTDPGIDVSNVSVAFHLLVIFIHGGVFFLLCSEFENVIFLASSSLPLNVSFFSSYVVMHVCLLLMNATWIGLIKLQERRLVARANAGLADESASVGSFWWQNNVICSLIGLAPFAVTGACQSDLVRCGIGAGTLAVAVPDWAPGSALQLAVAFQALTDMLSRLGFQAANASLLWVMWILVINSVVDLWTTGRYYLFFEDVEWESPLPSAAGTTAAPVATPAAAVGGTASVAAQP